jgi:hypothetical protein
MKDFGFKMQKPKVDCPICHKLITNNLGLHIHEKHSEEEFRQVVLKAKEKGIPDSEIGLQL